MKATESKLLLGLICVALLGCSRAKMPEPLVQGKPISAWVEAVKDADPNYAANAVSVLGDVGQPTNEVARAALRGVVSDPHKPGLLRGRAAVLLASQFNEQPGAEMVEPFKLLFYGDESARLQLKEILPTMTDQRKDVVKFLQEFDATYTFPRALRTAAAETLERCGEEGKQAMKEDFEVYKKNLQLGLEKAGDR